MLIRSRSAHSRDDKPSAAKAAISCSRGDKRSKILRATRRRSHQARYSEWSELGVLVTRSPVFTVGTSKNCGNGRGRTECSQHCVVNSEVDELQLPALRQTSGPGGHSEKFLPSPACVLDRCGVDFNEQCTGKREFSKQSVKELSRNGFKNKPNMNLCEGKNPPTVKRLYTLTNQIALAFSVMTGLYPPHILESLNGLIAAFSGKAGSSAASFRECGSFTRSVSECGYGAAAHTRSVAQGWRRDQIKGFSACRRW